MNIKKLSRIYPIGRYSDPDGRCLNVKKGKTPEGYDVLFYLYMGKRNYISDRDFSTWTRVEETA